MEVWALLLDTVPRSSHWMLLKSTLKCDSPGLSILEVLLFFGSNFAAKSPGTHSGKKILLGSGLGSTSAIF